MVYKKHSIALVLTCLTLFSISTISLADPVTFVDTFDSDLVSERYFISNPENFTLSNSEVRLSATSGSEGREDSRLVVFGEVDSIEATMRLSSESTANETPDFRSRARFMVSGTMYNELAEGGADGSLNDVFAQVFVAYNANGSISSLACASRSEDPVFSTFSNLDVDPNSDEVCGRFSTEIALDQSIIAGVSLDRTAKTITFKLGDEKIVYAIATDVFEPSEHFKTARARAEGESSAVVYVEDLTVSAPPIIPQEDTRPTITPILGAGVVDSLLGSVYSSSAVELFWQSTSSGPFELLRNGGSVYIGDGRSYFDAGLTASSINDYTLKTEDSEASLALVTFPEFTISGEQPAAPSELRGEAYSSSALEIFWNRVTTEPAAADYEVSRDGMILTALDGLSYFDSGLQAGTNYTYSVVSISASGQRSDPSALVIGTRGQ